MQSDYLQSIKETFPIIMSTWDVYHTTTLLSLFLNRAQLVIEAINRADPELIPELAENGRSKEQERNFAQYLRFSSRMAVFREHLVLALGDATRALLLAPNNVRVVTRRRHYHTITGNGVFNREPLLIVIGMVSFGTDRKSVV